MLLSKSLRNAVVHVTSMFETGKNYFTAANFFVFNSSGNLNFVYRQILGF